MAMHWASGRRSVCWLGSPVVLLAAGWIAGLRLNLTGSLPLGLYLERFEAAEWLDQRQDGRKVVTGHAVVLEHHTRESRHRELFNPLAPGAAPPVGSG
jgi:hypothetical protein